MKKGEFTFSTPAKEMWNGLNPLGRLFFFVPGCIAFYGLMLCFVPVFLCGTFVDWLEETRFCKWLDRIAKSIFGAKK